MKPATTSVVALLATFLPAVPLVAGSPPIYDSRSLLFAPSHAGAQPSASDFPAETTSFTTTLPWRDRFTPTGAFRPLQAAADDTPKAMVSSSTRETHTASATDAAYDAHGTVLEVRREANRLVIEHGPIDRHRMPAMTMSFEVHPSHLDRVKNGDQVRFSVEPGEAGMRVIDLDIIGGEQ